MAVAKEGKVKEVSSSAFVHTHSLSSVSSVQSALKVLADDETITVDEQTCYITNRFFSIWLKENY